MNQDRLQKEFEVARELDVSVSSLRRWRLQGRGPRFVRLGRAVRYRTVDVAAWVELHASENANDGLKVREVLAEA